MKNLYDDVFLYDLVHGQFAEAVGFNFYHEQISLAGSPVLEIACGSGHYLIPMAEKGLEITGLDISPTMLAACQRKAKERNLSVNLKQADMREFELHEKFKFIFIAGNSFQHLTAIKDITAFFECVKKHLAPGGKFIVEVFNPFIPLLLREPEKLFMVGEFGDYVLTEDVNYSVSTQINAINWHFWHRPTDQIKTLSFSMRQFFPQEFDALFEFNGFRIEKKFGDFDNSPFSDNSLKQIIVTGVF